jgi:hypothetical protein
MQLQAIFGGGMITPDTRSQLTGGWAAPWISQWVVQPEAMLF